MTTNTYTVTITEHERQTLISAAYGLKRTAKERGDAITASDADAMVDRLMVAKPNQVDA